MDKVIGDISVFGPGVISGVMWKGDHAQIVTLNGGGLVLIESKSLESCLEPNEFFSAFSKGIYSASIVDRDTMCCLHTLQAIDPPLVLQHICWLI